MNMKRHWYERGRHQIQMSGNRKTGRVKAGFHLNRRKELKTRSTGFNSIRKDKQIRQTFKSFRFNSFVLLCAVRCKCRKINQN